MKPEDKVRKLYKIPEGQAILYGAPAYEALTLFRYFPPLHLLCDSDEEVPSYLAISKQLFKNIEHSADREALQRTITVAQAQIKPLEAYIRHTTLTSKQEAPDFSYKWVTTATLIITQEYQINNEIKQIFNLGDSNLSLTAAQCVAIITAAEKLSSYFKRFNWSSGLFSRSLDDSQKTEVKKKLFIYLLKNPNIQLPQANINALQTLISVPEASVTKSTALKPILPTPPIVPIAPQEQIKAVETSVIKELSFNPLLTPIEKIVSIYKLENNTAIQPPSAAYNALILFRNFPPLHLICNTSDEIKSYLEISTQLFKRIDISADREILQRAVSDAQAHIKPLEQYIKNTVSQQAASDFNYRWVITSVLIIAKEYQVSEEIKNFFKLTEARPNLNAAQCIAFITLAQKLFPYFENFDWSKGLFTKSLNDTQKIAVKKRLLMHLLENPGIPLPKANISALQNIVQVPEALSVQPPQAKGNAIIPLVAEKKAAASSETPPAPNEKIITIYKLKQNAAIQPPSTAYDALILFRNFPPLHLLCNTSNEVQSYLEGSKLLFKNFALSADREALQRDMTKMIAQIKPLEPYIQNKISQQENLTFNYKWVFTCILIIAKEYQIGDEIKQFFKLTETSPSLDAAQCLRIINAGIEVENFIKDHPPPTEKRTEFIKKIMLTALKAPGILAQIDENYAALNRVLMIIAFLEKNHPAFITAADPKSKITPTNFIKLVFKMPEVMWAETGLEVRLEQLYYLYTREQFSAQEMPFPVYLGMLNKRPEQTNIALERLFTLYTYLEPFQDPLEHARVSQLLFLMKGDLNTALYNQNKLGFIKRAEAVLAALPTKWQDLTDPDPDIPPLYLQNIEQAIQIATRYLDEDDAGREDLILMPLILSIKDEQALIDIIDDKGTLVSSLSVAEKMLFLRHQEIISDYQAYARKNNTYGRKTKIFWVTQAVEKILALASDKKTAKKKRRVDQEAFVLQLCLYLPQAVTLQLKEDPLLWNRLRTLRQKLEDTFSARTTAAFHGFFLALTDPVLADAHAFQQIIKLLKTTAREVKDEDPLAIAAALVPLSQLLMAMDKLPGSATEKLARVIALFGKLNSLGEDEKSVLIQCLLSCITPNDLLLSPEDKVTLFTFVLAHPDCFGKKTGILDIVETYATTTKMLLQAFDPAQVWPQDGEEVKKHVDAYTTKHLKLLTLNIDSKIIAARIALKKFCLKYNVNPAPVSIPDQILFAALFPFALDQSELLLAINLNLQGEPLDIGHFIKTLDKTSRIFKDNAVDVAYKDPQPPELIAPLAKIIAYVYENKKTSTFISKAIDKLKKFKGQAHYTALAINQICAEITGTTSTVGYESMRAQLSASEQSAAASHNSGALNPEKTITLGADIEISVPLQRTGEAALTKEDITFTLPGTEKEWVTDLLLGENNPRAGHTYLADKEISPFLKKIVIDYSQNKVAITDGSLDFTATADAIFTQLNTNVPPPPADLSNIVAADHNALSELMKLILARKISADLGVDLNTATQWFEQHLIQYGIGHFSTPIARFLGYIFETDCTVSAQKNVTQTHIKNDGFYLSFVQEYKNITIATLDNPVPFTLKLTATYKLSAAHYELVEYRYSGLDNDIYLLQASLFYSQIFKDSIDQFKAKGIAPEKILAAIQRTLAMRALLYTENFSNTEPHAIQDVQRLLHIELEHLTSNRYFFSKEILNQLAIVLGVKPGSETLFELLLEYDLQGIHIDYPEHVYTLLKAYVKGGMPLEDLLEALVTPGVQDVYLLSVFQEVKDFKEKLSARFAELEIIDACLSDVIFENNAEGIRITVEDFIKEMAGHDPTDEFEVHWLNDALKEINKFYGFNHQDIHKFNQSSTQEKVKFIKTAAVAHSFIDNYKENVKALQATKYPWKKVVWKIKRPTLRRVKSKIQQKYYLQTKLGELGRPDKQKIFKIAAKNKELLYLMHFKTDIDQINVAIEKADNLLNSIFGIPAHNIKSAFIASDDYVKLIGEIMAGRSAIDKASLYKALNITDCEPSGQTVISQYYFKYPSVILYFLKKELSQTEKTDIASHLATIETKAFDLKQNQFKNNHQITVPDLLFVLIVQHNAKLADPAPLLATLEKVLAFTREATFFKSAPYPDEYLLLEAIALLQAKNIDIDLSQIFKDPANEFALDLILDHFSGFLQALLLIKDQPDVDFPALLQKINAAAAVPDTLFAATYLVMRNNVLDDTDKALIIKDIITLHQQDLLTESMKSGNLLEILTATQNTTLLKKYARALDREIKRKFTFIENKKSKSANPDSICDKLSRIYALFIIPHDKIKSLPIINDIQKSSVDHLNLIKCLWQFEAIATRYIQDQGFDHILASRDVLVKTSRRHFFLTGHIADLKLTESMSAKIFHILLYNEPFFNSEKSKDEINAEYLRLNDNIPGIGPSIRKTITTQTPYSVIEVLSQLGIDIQNYSLITPKSSAVLDINILLSLYLEYGPQTLAYIKQHVTYREGIILDPRAYQALSTAYQNSKQIAKTCTEITAIQEQNLFELLLAYPQLAQKITEIENIDYFYGLFIYWAAQMNDCGMWVGEPLYEEVLFYAIMLTARSHNEDANEILTYLERKETHRLIALGIAAEYDLDLSNANLIQANLIQAILTIYQSDLSTADKTNIYSKLMGNTIAPAQSTSLQAICHVVLGNDTFYQNHISGQKLLTTYVPINTKEQIKSYGKARDQLLSYVNTHYSQFFGDNTVCANNETLVTIAYYKYPALEKLFKKCTVLDAIDMGLGKKIMDADRMISAFFQAHPFEKGKEKEEHIARNQLFYIYLFYPDIINKIQDELDDNGNLIAIITAISELFSFIEKQPPEYITKYGNTVWDLITTKIDYKGPLIKDYLARQLRVDENSPYALPFIFLVIQSLGDGLLDYLIDCQKSNETYAKVIPVYEAMQTLLLDDDIGLTNDRFSFILIHPTLLPYVTSFSGLAYLMDNYKQLEEFLQNFTRLHPEKIRSYAEHIVQLCVIDADVYIDLVTRLFETTDQSIIILIDLYQDYAAAFELIQNSQLSLTEKEECKQLLIQRLTTPLASDDQIVDLPKGPINTLVAFLYNTPATSLDSDPVLDFCRTFTPELIAVRIDKNKYEEDHTHLTGVLHQLDARITQLNQQRPEARFLNTKMLNQLSSLLGYTHGGQPAGKSATTLLQACTNYHYSNNQSPFLNALTDALTALLLGKIDTLTYFDTLINVHEKATTSGQRALVAELKEHKKSLLKQMAPSKLKDYCQLLNIRYTKLTTFNDIINHAAAFQNSDLKGQLYAVLSQLTSPTYNKKEFIKSYNHIRQQIKIAMRQPGATPIIEDAIIFNLDQRFSAIKPALETLHVFAQHAIDMPLAEAKLPADVKKFISTLPVYFDDPYFMRRIATNTGINTLGQPFSVLIEYFKTQMTAQIHTSAQRAYMAEMIYHYDLFLAVKNYLYDLNGSETQFTAACKRIEEEWSIHKAQWGDESDIYASASTSTTQMTRSPFTQSSAPKPYKGPREMISMAPSVADDDDDDDDFDDDSDDDAEDKSFFGISSRSKPSQYMASATYGVATYGTAAYETATSSTSSATTHLLMNSSAATSTQSDINPNYQYENNEITTLLNLQLAAPLKIPPIVIGTVIDNIMHYALDTYLNDEKAGTLGPRTLIIPYNLGNAHWVGLCFLITAATVSVRYMDPLDNTGTDSVPADITQKIKTVYPAATINSVHYYDQSTEINKTSCGAVTIENLVAAATNQAPIASATTAAQLNEFRKKHVQLMQGQGGDPSFAKRQKSGLATTSNVHGFVAKEGNVNVADMMLQRTQNRVVAIEAAIEEIKKLDVAPRDALLAALRAPIGDARNAHEDYLNGVRAAIQNIPSLQVVFLNQHKINEFSIAVEDLQVIATHFKNPAAALKK